MLFTRYFCAIDARNLCLWRSDMHAKRALNCVCDTVKFALCASEIAYRCAVAEYLNFIYTIDLY